MTTIFLDIETAPCQDADTVRRLSCEIVTEAQDEKAAVKAPSNYKDPEKIEAYVVAERAKIDADMAQRIEDRIAKTSFDGAFGRIVCIGMAVDDNRSVAQCSTDEPMLLRWMFETIDNATEMVGYNERIALSVGGHNVSGFDLPFIKKRAIIHGIKPPVALRSVFDAKPWDKTILDTMLMWDSDKTKRISLDALCKALGIQTPKNGMDGSMVAAAFAAGEYDRIATYCAADVEATRACYKRMVWQ